MTDAISKPKPDTRAIRAYWEFPTLLREDVEWLVWFITGADKPNIDRIVAALEAS